jgi:formimidoylglutamate deiminase
LTPGSPADFFTVDREDVSIAGHSGEDLLPLAVFSLSRSAIRDVVVNGRWIVRDQRHLLQDEIVSRFKELHRKLWGRADFL